MRICAGVPWRWGVKRQWVIENMDFQGFWTLRLRHLRKSGQHYYFVPCRLSTDPKTHDLEQLWMVCLNGHFTLNFHYYELPLGNYLLLIYSRVCLHRGLRMWPAEKCGKRSSGPRSADYLESAEKLRIFRKRYIVGTLTNKPTLL